MRAFIVINLTFLISAGQWLVSSDVLAAPVPPDVQAWTSVQITNTLQEVEEIWKEPSDAYLVLVERILQLMPNEPHALKALLKGISNLPISPAETGMTEADKRLTVKWNVLSRLASHALLRNEPATWEALASMVGGARLQIVKDYHPSFQWDSRIDPRETEQERGARMEENDRKYAMDSFQSRLSDIDRKWGFSFVDRINNLAFKMPSDARKQFLDKIKELARSDEDEAKLLDKPIPVERPGLPVEFARSQAAHLPPVARKKFLDSAKKGADYTEEELKILDAPFE